MKSPMITVEITMKNAWYEKLVKANSAKERLFNDGELEVIVVGSA